MTFSRRSYELTATIYLFLLCGLRLSYLFTLIHLPIAFRVNLCVFLSFEFHFSSTGLYIGPHIVLNVLENPSRKEIFITHVSDSKKIDVGRFPFNQQKTLDGMEVLLADAITAAASSHRDSMSVKGCFSSHFLLSFDYSGL